MILQYKGFNNNWCYTEAETIVWANVWVGKETRDYRKNGARWKLHQEELSKCTTEEEKQNLQLKYAKEMHEAINKLIQKETQCYKDIIFHVNCPFDEMENVCVVSLMDKNQAIPVTNVFDNGVYLLNNHGQTVQRIA